MRVQCAVNGTVNANPFVDMFGSTLYKWSDAGQDIEQLDTIKLLKNKNVVGIYFSASWWERHEVHVLYVMC